ncbi:hypothetical protein ILP92_03500 [Maribius pontilimi]|uniref:Uncharacterized protein n=1 Tax=Palleronia pontilimi TaxID=1964209 RepID=A0A934I7R8_9RHOB|nr:hypothetical protein [Palleronia pontilimi]MBJ3761813.1 hypothetical protein [Palleronia pontilimi]
MRALPAFLLAALLTTACDIPQLDVPNAAALARQDPPQLLPTSQISARAGAIPARITPQTTAGLEARAANLRARAGLLRQSALTAAERERLRGALGRLRARTDGT